MSTSIHRQLEGHLSISQTSSPVPAVGNQNRMQGNKIFPCTDPVPNHFDKHLNIAEGNYIRNYRRRQSPGAAFQSTSVVLESQFGKSSSLVFILTFVASISGFMFGYDTGYISSVLATIDKDLEGVELTIGQIEWISSATSLGALCASLVAGLLVDIIGRKYTVISCDVLFVIGTLMQCFSETVNTMIYGRLIMGLGVGIGSLCAPLYIGELAPGKFRGQMVVINCLAITGGQLVAYMVGALCSGLESGWRYIVGISLLPCLVQFFSMIFLPDTPRYLIMREKYDEATEVLKKIYPDASIELIEANVEELSNFNEIWKNETTAIGKLKSSWVQLFSVDSNKRALIIACGLQGIQQFVGFNALMYFSSSIFKMVGYENATGVSCFIAGTNFFVTIIALFIIDRVGRRRILLISMPLLCLAQLVCALAFSHLNISLFSNKEKITTITSNWRYVLLAGMMMFVAFYAIGLGNVPWQQAELFPQKVRGLGTSFATSTNWFGSMVLSSSFLSLMQFINPVGTFILFAVITLISTVFVYFLYPELGGLQLEEVEKLLKDGFNVKKSEALHNSCIVSDYNHLPVI